MLKRVIRKYAIVSSLMSAIFGLQLPVFYLMLREKGLDLSEVGALIAASTICAMVFDIPLGALADSIGKKRVLLMAELCLLVVTAGFWLARSFAWLLAVMALNGLCRAMFSGTLDGLFAEKLKELGNSEEEGARLQRGLATVGSISALTLAIGAVLGGCMPGWLSGVTRESHWVGHYEINFVVMLPLIVLHLLLTALMIGEGRRKSRVGEMKQLIRRSGRLVGATPILLGLVVLQFVGGMAFVSVETLWQPRLAELVDPHRHGWVFGALTSAGFVAVALGQGLSSRLTRSFNYHLTRMLLAVEMATAVMLALFALQREMIGVVVSYCLLLMLSGVAIPPTLTLFHRKVEDDLRSTMLSVKSCFEQGGAVIGALLAGAASQHYGIDKTWFVAALVVFAGTFIYRVPAIKAESLRLANGMQQIAGASGEAP